MKIAFILPSLANRGPIIFTKYLIDELSKQHEITVFYFKDIKEKTFPDNCKVMKIDFFNTINFKCFDIVHTTMLKPDLYSFYHKIITRKNTCISISGIHNIINDDMIFNYGKVKGRIIAYIWMNILKFMDAYIYSSKDMSDIYNKKLPISKGYIIPYGITKITIDTSILLPFEKKIIALKKNYTIIGAVGLLIARKGFHQIILSLKKLEKHSLVIVGDGPEKIKLIKLAEENNLSDRVLFVGFYPDSTQYYKYFDIYCLSSYSEGFGLAMLEALSIGLPLVCSDLAIYNTFFKKDDICFFKLDNIDDLSAAIEKATNNSYLFSKKSLALFKKHFTSSNMAYAHTLLYSSLIEKNEK